jgi:hypothetical protein
LTADGFFIREKCGSASLMMRKASREDKPTHHQGKGESNEKGKESNEKGKSRNGSVIGCVVSVGTDTGGDGGGGTGETHRVDVRKPIRKYPPLFHSRSTLDCQD